jgi:hypothetical protein
MCRAGKRATVTGITIVRFVAFVDAKIVGSWQAWDRLGLLRLWDCPVGYGTSRKPEWL